jgi:hypothetical protein
MPTHLVAHLQFTPASAKAKIAKEPPSQRSTKNRQKMTTIQTTEKKGEGITKNSGKKQLFSSLIQDTIILGS